MIRMGYEHRAAPFEERSEKYKAEGVGEQKIQQLDGNRRPKPGEPGDSAGMKSVTPELKPP